jgi:hypothetical protein
MARSTGERCDHVHRGASSQPAVVEEVAALRDAFDLAGVVTDPEQRRLPLPAIIGEQGLDPPAYSPDRDCRSVRRAGELPAPASACAATPAAAARRSNSAPLPRSSRQPAGELFQPVVLDPVREVVADPLRPPLALGHHQRHRATPDGSGRLLNSSLPSRYTSPRCGSRSAIARSRSSCRCPKRPRMQTHSAAATNRSIGPTWRVTSWWMCSLATGAHRSALRGEPTFPLATKKGAPAAPFPACPRRRGSAVRGWRYAYVPSAGIADPLGS